MLVGCRGVSPGFQSVWPAAGQSRANERVLRGYAGSSKKVAACTQAAACSLPVMWYCWGSKTARCLVARAWNSRKPA